MAVRAARKPTPFTAAVHRLAAAPDPACLLDLEGTFLFANEAWDRFALANGGGGAVSASALVGTRLADRIAGEEPRRAFRMLLTRVVRGAGRPGAPLVQTSENNGPDVARLVTARYEPVLGPDAVMGVAVVHRTVRELPVGEVYAPVDGGARSWRDAAGALEQCSCCRRTRRPESPDDWDFVPGLVAATPPDATFSYCPLCRELHHAAGAAGGGPSP